jgi:Tfp pilus assembly protein PilO
LLFIFLGISYRVIFNFQVTGVRAFSKRIEKKMEFNKLYQRDLGLKQWLKLRLKKLPKNKDINWLLVKVRNEIKAENLDIISINPVTIEQHKFFYLLPVEIQVKGSYHQIGRFIAKLENEGGLRIDSIEMYPIKIEEEKSEGYKLKTTNKGKILLLTKLKISSITEKK